MSVPADALFGLFDQEIDPGSLDYVDTTEGAWAETASSRTAVMCVLSVRYNSWPPDPEIGVLLYEWFESGTDITPEMVVDDTRRALQLLVADGMIADLAVAVETFDLDSRAAVIAASYTDVSSGHVVEFQFSPF